MDSKAWKPNSFLVSQVIDALQMLLIFFVNTLGLAEPSLTLLMTPIIVTGVSPSVSWAQ